MTLTRREERRRPFLAQSFRRISTSLGHAVAMFKSSFPSLLVLCWRRNVMESIALSCHVKLTIKLPEKQISVHCLL